MKEAFWDCSGSKYSHAGWPFGRVVKWRWRCKSRLTLGVVNLIRCHVHFKIVGTKLSFIFFALFSFYSLELSKQRNGCDQRWQHVKVGCNQRLVYQCGIQGGPGTTSADSNLVTQDTDVTIIIIRQAAVYKENWTIYNRSFCKLTLTRPEYVF